MWPACPSWTAAILNCCQATKKCKGRLRSPSNHSRDVQMKKTWETKEFDTRQTTSPINEKDRYRKMTVMKRSAKWRSYKKQDSLETGAGLTKLLEFRKKYVWHDDNVTRQTSHIKGKVQSDWDKWSPWIREPVFTGAPSMLSEETGISAPLCSFAAVILVTDSRLKWLELQSPDKCD